MTTLRSSVLKPLVEPNPVIKANLTMAINMGTPVGANADIARPTGIPGRPTLPKLVKATELRLLSLRTNVGRAGLIHSIVHIELNAIDLALDIASRFTGMPDQFYIDWVTIAKEEVLHFTLLRDHL